MQREPVDTLTLVIRAKDGQSLESIRLYCQAGANVAIGRGLAVIQDVVDGRIAAPPYSTRDPLDYCPEWLLPASWRAFCEMREKIGRPLTSDTARYNVARLVQFREEGYDAESIVDQTVQSQWMNFHLTASSKRMEASA